MSKKECRGDSSFHWKRNRSLLEKKVRGDRGFTLVEMLIVVAVIAILIAISIPLVNNALERARHATDAANERAAKAAMLLWYMMGESTIPDGDSFPLAYDAANGDFKVCIPNSPLPIIPYGKHNAGGAEVNNHKDKVIFVRMVGEEVRMEWRSAPAANAPSNGGLCSLSESVAHD